MNILIRIREIQNLSENEQSIANYILKNPGDVVNFSCYELAKKSYTSPATVSRFCKKLKVKNFIELKTKLSVSINNINNNHKFLENNREIEKDDNTKEIIEKIYNISHQTIMETKLLQDPKIIDLIVDKIIESKILDFYGSGISHFVALDANYKFMRAGKQTAAYSLRDQQHIQAKNSTSDHLAIIFSYSGESEEMVSLAQILSENKTPVISITNYRDNTLSKMANFNLYVTSRESIIRSSATYSRTSMLYLIDILYSIFMNKNYDQVIKTLSKNRINKEIKQKQK